MELIVAKQAAKAMMRMPKQDARALQAKLESFAAAPFAAHPWAKRLQGLEGVRVRHGDWRAVCEIHRERLVVVVVKVGNRREIYR